MVERNPITPEGYTRLVADLQRFREVVRPQVVRDIETARAHGDISENSEYEDAKERQAYTEGKIAELERLVSAAEIIDVGKITPADRVVFGVTVRLSSQKGDDRRYRIVGETETDVNAGLISWKSPLAKALIGRRSGDEVEVPAPGGRQMWEIIEIVYR